MLLSCHLLGCGFHLRGVGDELKFENLKNIQVYLAVANDDELFHQQLQRDLKFANTHLIDDVNSADWHLIILSVKTEKNSVGIDRNGRSNEYEVKMEVEFIVGSQSMLDDVKGVIGENTNNRVLSVSRNVYFDNNDQIGQRSEEKNILAAMRAELSKRVINSFFISVTK